VSSLIDVVLGLYEAAGVVIRCDVAEFNVVGQRAEERDSFPDQDGDSGDDQALNETSAEEALDCYASVDVEVVGACGGKFRNDFGWNSGHLLDDASSHSREVEGATAQHYDALAAVGPLRKSENGLEGIAADDKRIDTVHKLVVTVGFAAAGRKEVESAIAAGDEAVDTGSDKDGRCHDGGSAFMIACARAGVKS
jgi:hypothetical protein